jgi:hypothetical protein
MVLRRHKALLAQLALPARLVQLGLQDLQVQLGRLVRPDLLAPLERLVLRDPLDLLEHLARLDRPAQDQ